MKFEGIGDSSYSMRGGLQVTSEVLIRSLVDKNTPSITVEASLSETEHTANAIKALENYNLVKSDQAADYENEIRK